MDLPFLLLLVILQTVSSVLCISVSINIRPLTIRSFDETQSVPNHVLYQYLTDIGTMQKTVGWTRWHYACWHPVGSSKRYEIFWFNGLDEKMHGNLYRCSNRTEHCLNHYTMIQWVLNDESITGIDEILFITSFGNYGLLMMFLEIEDVRWISCNKRMMLNHSSDYEVWWYDIPNWRVKPVQLVLQRVIGRSHLEYTYRKMKWWNDCFHRLPRLSK